MSKVPEPHPPHHKYIKVMTKRIRMDTVLTEPKYHSCYSLAMDIFNEPHSSGPA
jgi:hypothetical protein